MAINTRFTGTYKFIERDRYVGRPLPPIYDRYILEVEIQGTLTFKVCELDDTLIFSRTRVLAQGECLQELHKDAVDKIKSGGVDKLIKNLIIDIISEIKRDKDSKTIEEQYKELTSGVNKINVELNVKQRDL